RRAPRPRGRRAGGGSSGPPSTPRGLAHDLLEEIIQLRLDDEHRRPELGLPFASVALSPTAGGAHLLLPGERNPLAEWAQSPRERRAHAPYAHLGGLDGLSHGLAAPKGLGGPDGRWRHGYVL